MITINKVTAIILVLLIFAIGYLTGKYYTLHLLKRHTTSIEERTEGDNSPAIIETGKDVNYSFEEENE